MGPSINDVTHLEEGSDICDDVWRRGRGFEKCDGHIYKKYGKTSLVERHLKYQVTFLLSFSRKPF